MATIPTQELPIIIVGAGISGLLLAQQLRKSSIPFQIFERDADFLTRGVGWGLTLHWSLPALRELLPADLLAQLPETYVDRAAVQRGESSTFPFFDLSTGELKSSSPRASEDQRIRVTREQLRRLLATAIDIKWGKIFTKYHENNDFAEAVFEDGFTCRGRLIIGCDGIRSRVRCTLFPQNYTNHPIPVRMLGFTLRVTADQAKPIQQLDPFFLQGTASSSDIFMYISLLEAPQDPSQVNSDYIYQVCISWNTNKTNFGDEKASSGLMDKNDLPLKIRSIAKNWAEPFRSFIQLVPDTTNIKQLNIEDYIPNTVSSIQNKVLLIGDAAHAMAMYRGEGANHAIIDVLDMKNNLLPYLQDSRFDVAVRAFEAGIVKRTQPAVLASRQAYLDAHDWAGLTSQSPLLPRRMMWL